MVESMYGSIRRWMMASAANPAASTSHNPHRVSR